LWFDNKMKRAARVTGLAIGLFAVYVLLYFALMVPETSYDAGTGNPKFGSAFRFAPNVRLPWDITIYGRSAHWANYFFLPLDRVFNRAPAEDGDMPSN